ncbi:MAG: glycosyltransferase family 4 protein [Acidobacteriota bacterium]
MRIVYLSPSGRMGGAEVALLDMLASVRQAEPEWTLHLIVSEEGGVAEKARALGVSTHVLPFPASLARIGDAAAGGPAGHSKSRLHLLAQLLLAAPAVTIYVRKLRTRLGRLEPEVIHSNGFKMHLLGAMANRRTIPLIWHFHDYLTARPFMSRLIKLFRKRCSMALANSNSVRLDVTAVCGDAMPIQTIYNGIDTAVFTPRGESADLDLLSGLPEAGSNTIRVGMLATFARWKGHETFLRAIALLKPDFPVRGYVVGDALYQTDGSQYSLGQLKEMARQLGISSRIGFTGFVSNPATAMRSLDIMVHASTQPEPFGLVIVEGMACGRAVIVSEAGGAAELIESGINALGHPPGDAVRLSERLMELASDASLRTRLGEAGRSTAERRFNRTRLSTELTAIYRRVAATAAADTQPH